MTKANDNKVTNNQGVNKAGDKKSLEPQRSSGNEVQKSKPVRGTASRVCGCYGTYHQSLANCLYCGRISCSEEGYDFCPFCGFLVEDVNDGEE